MKIFNHIIVFGDIHGEWDVIPNFIRDYQLSNCAIIVAGDFGIGFAPMKDELRRIKNISKRMKHTDSTLFAIRGNHDNPEYFTGEFDTDRFKLVPDYTVLNLNNINILCVGGAYSVDRVVRRSYYNPREKKSDVIVVNDYWKDEVFNYDHDKVMSLKDINVVVTHSAPNVAPPYLKSGLDTWAVKDENIIQDCDIERSQLSQMYTNLIDNGNKISLWFYGHFHQSNTIEYNGTRFIGLSINQYKEIINYENG